MQIARLPPAALVGAILLAAAPLAVPSWILFILTLALAKFMAVLAVALFLRAGVVSFGHGLFYAVGAYAVGFGVKWAGLRDALLLVPLGTACAGDGGALVGAVVAAYRRVF